MFKGYPDPEWVHGKHLEDAGAWVQGKMTEARTIGKPTQPLKSSTRRSPRLAQTVNHVDCTPPEHISPESRWITSKDDYEVLGMIVCGRNPASYRLAVKTRGLITPAVNLDRRGKEGVMLRGSLTACLL